jgi:tetratricopeptide (TPR) repeat protein
MTPLGEAEGPAVVELAVQAAAARFTAGDTDAALALLSPLVASGSPSLAARFLLAMMAWQMGRLDGALDLVRECHAQDPMDGTVAEALASLYAQSGNAVESIYAAKLATALGGHGALGVLVPGGFPPFELAYAAIKEQPRRARAQRDLAAGRFEDALENARQHVALEGADPDGRAFYAALLLRAGRACDAVDEMRAIEDEASRAAPLASLYGRSLALAGEFAAALRWHGDALALAPADAALAAARIVDGRWLDEPQAQMRSGADWARKFCPPRPPRAARATDGKIVIAYLVNALEDRGGAAAIASVAQAHDRSRFTVIGYGHGAQSWEENAALSGAFDRWQDVAALDAATIARYLRHDAVDVAVDASGFAAPHSILALARADRALRVSWLGNPAALMAPIYDARIAAASERASPGTWPIAGGYPIPRAQKHARRGGGGPTQFGADVGLPQLGDDTVALWSAILRASADAKLLLRASDTGRGTVDRLIARFGTELASRIDLVSVERFEEFYALVDVALAPRRGLSPRLAAEAVACGVPVVAFAAASAVEPYGAFLHGIGCGASCTVAHDGDYIRRALDLAAAAEAHEPDGTALDAAAFARTLDDHIARALRGEPRP